MEILWKRPVEPGWHADRGTIDGTDESTERFWADYGVEEAVEVRWGE